MQEYSASVERENQMRELRDVGVVIQKCDGIAVVRHVYINHPICI